MNVETEEKNQLRGEMERERTKREEEKREWEKEASKLKKDVKMGEAKNNATKIELQQAQD